MELVEQEGGAGFLVLFSAHSFGVLKKKGRTCVVVDILEILSRDGKRHFCGVGVLFSGLISEGTKAVCDGGRLTGDRGLRK